MHWVAAELQVCGLIRKVRLCTATIRYARQSTSTTVRKISKGCKSNELQSIFRADAFADKVIVVTGGGSGIGRCTAHELASLGAQVVITGRKIEKLEKSAKKF